MEDKCLINIYNKPTLSINNGVDIECYKDAYNRESYNNGFNFVNNEELIYIITNILQNYIRHEFNITEINYVNKQDNINSNYYVIFQISYINHNNYPLFATKKLFINFEIIGNTIKVIALKDAPNSYESIIDRPTKYNVPYKNQGINTLSLLYNNNDYNDDIFLKESSTCYNMDLSNYQKDDNLSNYPVLFENTNYMI